MMRPRRTIALLLTTAAAACAASGGPTDDPRTVVVHNPTGAVVTLHRVVRDGFGATRALGTDRRIERQLAPGRYALALDGAPPRCPLPLPARELGYEPPATLAVTVRPVVDQTGDWRWIAPGPTLRGDALGVGQEDERPVATPHVDGFWLATTETTNAQYATFLNSIPRDDVDPAWLDFDGSKCRVRWDEAADAFTTDAPRLPVVTVSWFGAIAYCDHLTGRTGSQHRLPTETEWEKAARGPGSRVYAYGDTCRTDAANQESGRLREVGQFEPNGYGLFDMTANAFEWCADPYVRGAYAGERTPDDDAGFRVLRGGSYVLDGIFCRNAMRMRLRAEVRADDVGFRVVRDAGKLVR